MFIIFFVVLMVLFPLTVIIPMAYYYKGERSLKKGKYALAMNIIAFCIVTALASAFIFSGNVFATPAPHPPVAATQNTQTSSGEIALAAAFIAAALVTGLGAIGTGIAVSAASAAAIGAISENENNFGKAMIFVAMAEGIAIYGLLISFMILGRV